MAQHIQADTSEVVLEAHVHMVCVESGVFAGLQRQAVLQQSEGGRAGQLTSWVVLDAWVPECPVCASHAPKTRGKA
jgi:hypothetical protein